MKKIFVLVFLGCLLSPLFAKGTVVLPANIKQLATLSEYIFLGECLERQNELDLAGSGHLVTHYTFKVKEWIKGESWTDDDSVVVFTQLAQGTFTVEGRAVRQNLYGPEYEVGETYLLMLPKPSVKGLVFPMGMFQGVYHVKTDEDGVMRVPELKGRTSLLRHGLKTKSSSKDKSLSLQLNATKEDDSYAGFKTLIQSALEE